MKKHIYTLVIFLFICQAVSAYRFNFNGYTSANGLSSDYVETLMVDSDGFLWIGTYDGLNRFDGKSFVKFISDAGDENTLTGGNITCIFQDSKKRIWVSTQKGLCMYNPEVNNFKRISYFDNISIFKMFESRGEIWLLSRTDLFGIRADSINGKKKTIELTRDLVDKEITCGLMHNDTLWFTSSISTILYFPLSTQKLSVLGLPESLSRELINIKAFEFDSKECFWIGLYSKGILRISRDLKILDRYRHDESNRYTLGSDNVWNFFKDNKGAMWVQCINGNLNYYDNNQNYFHRFAPDRFNDQSISGSSITCMTQDKNGSYWIGTHGSGLQCINANRNRFVVFNPTFSINKFSDNNITCFTAIDNTNLWFGTNDAGLIRYTYFTQEMKNFTMNDGISSNTITALVHDKDNNLWLGTWGGGLCKFNPRTNVVRTFTNSYAGNKHHPILNIKHLFISDNTLWVANNEGTVYSFDIVNEQFTSLEEYTKDVIPRVYGNNSAMIDSKNRIWVSTQNGLMKVENGKLTIFTERYNTDNSLKGEKIQCVYEDKAHHIWVLSDRGLFLFDGHNGFFNQREVSKLCHNLTSIIESDDGELWMGSTAGIIEFNPRTKRVKLFTTEEGLPSNVFSPNSIYALDNGCIVMGSTHGFVYFNQSVSVMNTVKPAVYFTGIDVNNVAQIPGAPRSILKKDIRFTDTVFIKYKAFFSISFAAVDLFANSKVKFKYLLDGFNEEWIDAKSTSVPYTNLDPGEYTFRVKAINSDNVSDNKGAHIHIVILPPWWKTSWFKIISAITLVLVFLQWYLRIKSQKKQLKIMVANRTQELENALDEVQIQNEVIAIQKNEVVRQKNEMAYANKVITSSIEYAKHIQLAMLPNTDAWQRFKDKHFVLYMPQHIVSGDFYWIKTTGKHTYVAVADCTGHGVPGAFMSVMGISFINQIISSNCTLDTATILNIIRFKIKESLRQSNEYNTSRDGMDMSLCKIHHSNLSVEFSGANSNMYISRKDAHDQEVEVIKGEKMPVGVHLVEEPFTSQRVQLTAGDVFYLSSDGFADQVNDHNGKKLMSKKYRELLSSLSSLPMNERGEKLKSEFLAWKGSADQVDDVTVVGIQL